MAYVTIPAYTGDQPDRGQSRVIFNANMNYFFSWAHDFPAAMNSAGASIEALSDDAVAASSTAISAKDLAVAAAAAADISADQAAAFANFKGPWSGLTGSFAQYDTTENNGIRWYAKVAIANIAANEPTVENATWGIVIGSAGKRNVSSAGEGYGPKTVPDVSLSKDLQAFKGQWVVQTGRANPPYFVSHGGDVVYFNKSFSLLGQDDTPRSIAWDGQYFWVVGDTTNIVYRYTRTGVYTGVGFSVFSEEPVTQGITWDGSHFWVVGNGSTAFQYTSDGNYTGTSFSLSSEDSAPLDIAWDGSNFWVVGNTTDTVYQYTAGGAYTGTSFSVAAQETIPQGLTWDGSHFWLVGSQIGMAHKYTGAGSYTGISFSVSSQDATPTGIAWDGESFWISGNNTDAAYQYGHQNQTIYQLLKPIADIAAVEPGTDDTVWSEFGAGGGIAYLGAQTYTSADEDGSDNIDIPVDFSDKNWVDVDCSSGTISTAGAFEFDITGLQTETPATYTIHIQGGAVKSSVTYALPAGWTADWHATPVYSNAGGSTAAKRAGHTWIEIHTSPLSGQNANFSTGDARSY